VTGQVVETLSASYRPLCGALLRAASGKSARERAASKLHSREPPEWAEKLFRRIVRRTTRHEAKITPLQLEITRARGKVAREREHDRGISLSLSLARFASLSQRLLGALHLSGADIKVYFAGLNRRINSIARA